MYSIICPAIALSLAGGRPENITQYICTECTETTLLQNNTSKIPSVEKARKISSLLNTINIDVKDVTHKYHHKSNFSNDLYDIPYSSFLNRIVLFLSATGLFFSIFNTTLTMLLYFKPGYLHGYVTANQSEKLVEEKTYIKNEQNSESFITTDNCPD